MQPASRKSLLLLLCASITAFAAIVPVCRSFIRFEINYNEGWNLYNAEALGRHQLLYPAHYGWTTVNYPMLSFALLGHLHGPAGDRLLPARIVSLVALLLSSLLVGAIARRLGTSRFAASLAALFCFAVFCAAEDNYVGVDDPQLLAHAIFLLGLYLYLRLPRTLPSLALVAAVFILATSVKHNAIDFPLAILLDLLFVAVPLALWFAACLSAFAACSVLLHLHFGGPGFIQAILAPRDYTAAFILDRARDAFGPILLPMLAAALVAVTTRNHPRRRVVALLFACSVIIGGAFAGGHGVSINAFFSAIFAACILLGLLLERFLDLPAQPALPPEHHRLHQLRPLVPIALFTWLVIPLLITGNWDPARAMRDIEASHQHFAQRVAILRSHPGPALCESLLACHDAGKPYLYDPFNATRLVDFGKLDPHTLTASTEARDFSAVQFDETPGKAEEYERFTPALIRTVEQNYAPLPLASAADGMIYLPRAANHHAASTYPTSLFPALP